MKKPLWLWLTIVLITGCHHQETIPEPAAKKTVDPNSVEPPAALRSRLKLSKVTPQLIAEHLRVAGKIDFDEQRLARIGANITGRVISVRGFLGQSVKSGEVLAYLNSHELSNYQLAYLKARSEQELNRKNLQRARLLFKADVIAAAELERRENEYQVSVAETRAASDQLQLLGVGSSALKQLGQKGAINSVTPVVSTLKGIVVERKLVPGQVVQPGDTLFVVADLAWVWVVAQVPEQQISRVKVGQSVSIEIPALHEKRVGKLIFVDHTVNPVTRTVLVRTALENKDGQLKPAMLASMLIEAQPVEKLVIPSSAVVRENDQDHIFVVGNNGVFHFRKVQLGTEYNHLRVVESGLKSGESVVVEGAFHLNNERNRQEMEGGA